MSGLIKAVAYAAVVGISLVAPQVMAGTFAENIYWISGDAAGQHAATCYIYYPDEKPLAVPRTLVVDQNTPDGTVLFQWGYGEFMSDTTLHCISSGISNSNSASGGSPNFVYFLSNYAPYSGVHGLLTSDTGIQLKILARYNTACAYVGSSRYYLQSYGTVNCLAAGTEVDANASPMLTGYLAHIMTAYYSGGRYYLPTAAASMSLRAALIKQGSISYSSALNVNSASNFYLRMGTGSGGYTTIASILASSATRIVPPACRLRTTDYTIPMGRWAADAIAYVGIPAYGSQVPVNLSLECSGRVNHVRFRFEDTGTSLSGNKNISLYDTVGGNKIDGLEIEIFYNGVKVSVDNSTLTDTGGHGVTKASPASLPLYDSVSTAAFYARYVQNAVVTRSGGNYTGPVTGKVNMYVTYD